MRDSVRDLLKSLDSPFTESDIQLDTYPQRRHSRFLRDTALSLPVSVHDPGARRSWTATEELQVAKLDPMTGWRLWVTIAWYVNVDI